MFGQLGRHAQIWGLVGRHYVRKLQHFWPL